MYKVNFLLLLLLCFSATAQEMKPANKNASPEAMKLLKYLHQIDDEHILAGQHNYNRNPTEFLEKAHEITGKYPAIWGTDFIWQGTKDPGREIVQEAIKKYREGYIVTLMWHSGRPTDTPPYQWKESIQGELTDGEWKELTTPGTDLHRRWLSQVDTIATYLKDLRDAHVPVLWRPYHEMNGVWFWWGDKKGKNGYAKLWKMMFDRFVNYHHLDNLLWVWNANAPRDIPKDEAFDYKNYFPGRDYVDVLATDVYHFDYEQRDYEQLLKLAKGKLIALGEVGELPKTEILEAQPKWTWFMVWSNWLVDHNSTERVSDVYNFPATLTHDEVKKAILDISH